MASQKTEFLTPAMRMVQGDPFEMQTKDMQGNPLTVKTGQNMGQPTQRYFVAGAIAKNDPAWPAFYQLLFQAAKAGFPTLFDANGTCLARDFSWKIADGDSTMVSRPGETPNAQKEGFPGNWIVKFSSSFPPKVFYAGHYAPHEVIQDRNVLRRGDYIRVFGTAEANGNAQKPGIYVNLGIVEFAGKGVEIVTGPNASAIFGGNAAQLPAGAQPLPMHAGNGLPGQMPMAQPGQTFSPPVAGFGAPPAQPFAPQAPQQFAPAAVAPNVVVTPNPAFLQGPGTAAPPAFPGVAPAAGGFVPPMNNGLPSAGNVTTSPISPGALPGMPGLPMQQLPPAVAHVMLPAAQGHTYEALRGMGYTDEFMRANGMMQ